MSFSWSDLPPEDKALHDMVGDSYPLEEALRVRGLVAKEKKIDPNSVNYLEGKENDLEPREPYADAPPQGPKKQQRDQGEIRDCAEQLAEALGDSRLEFLVDVVELVGPAEAQRCAEGATKLTFLERARALVDSDSWHRLYSDDARRQRHRRQQERRLEHEGPDMPTEWATDVNHLMKLLHGDKPPSIPPPETSIAARLYR